MTTPPAAFGPAHYIPEITPDHARRHDPPYLARHRHGRGRGCHRRRDPARRARLHHHRSTASSTRPHGRLDIDSYDVDGYVVSPYKVFSRHGYGVAWVSDRLHAIKHEHLIDAPGNPWEFGTRDTGAYVTFSDVVDYFDWLGAQVSDRNRPPRADRRRRRGDPRP